MLVATSRAPVPNSYRSNLLALVHAQKPARGTPAYSRIVNRPAARRVAALAHTVGITPNAVTVTSAAFSAAGLVLLCLARPSWWVGVAVAALLATGFLLDSVDGQLARLGNGGTAAGEWLDHNVDCIKTTALHLAVLVSWYRFPPVDSSASLLLPLGFQVVDLVVFFGFVMMPLLRQVHARTASQESTTPAAEHPLRMWLILPTDYGAFCWMFVVLGWPEAFFAVYAGMFAINAAVLPLALRKWWRELRAYDLAEA
jgi:phosphatidylglycerophosphate synthase